MAVSAEAPRQELVLLEPRDRPQLEAERAALLAEIERELPGEIISPLEYSAVAELERRLGRFIAKAEPLFDEHCSAAHRVWRQACEIRALFLDVPQKLKARTRQLLGDYKAAEDQRRRDRELALAEEERQKQLARQKAEAKLAERQGQPELAKAIRAEPVDAPAVVLPDEVPNVGLSFREDWCWAPIGGDTPRNRQRTIAMLVRPDYAGLVKLDDAGLTAFARRWKGTVRVPGVMFFSRQVPVRR